ncbi:MAG: hypothetical protein ACTHOH_16600 [Lysobacteraceae bacterium]
MTSWRAWMGTGLVLACTACGAVPPTRPEAAATAQIARSCAPWDGAAFTVSVPATGDGVDPAALPALRLSVWSAPQFDGERTVVFAEGDDRTGMALYAETVDRATPLTGEATFRQAADGSIEGTLRLKAADGRRFERRFRGRLDPATAMCG